MLDLERAKGERRAMYGLSPPSWQNYRQRMGYEEQLEWEKQEEARRRSPGDPAVTGIDAVLLLVGIPLLFLAAAIDSFWPNILEPSSAPDSYRWVAWTYHVLLAIPMTFAQQLFAFGASLGVAHAAIAGWSLLAMGAIVLLVSLVLIRRWTKLPVFSLLITLYVLPGIAALGWAGFTALTSQ